MHELTPNNENIANALCNAFGHKRVFVVGDLMLDRYIWGQVERISPEAPVPVLRPGREATRAGGAGNVALNLAGLGLDVAVAGFVGKDENGDRLLDILAERGVDTAAVVTLSDRPTITKTRVISGHQHVLRIDSEDLSDIENLDHDDLFEIVISTSQVDAIILSDYAKGALPLIFCQRLIETAKQISTPVLVDPKGTDFSKYAGASILTPNLRELSQAGGVPAEHMDDLIRSARAYVDALGLQFLVVTRGPDGMTLVAEDQTVHSPAKAREVFDVSGAGDTVIASVAAAMLGGLEYVDMLHMANLAAGFVVGRVGTAAIDQASLMRALHAEEQSASKSVYSLDELIPLVDDWRNRDQRIVLTNGCFDIVHTGHVSFLHKAAREGDKLIVGINTDRSVRALKGNSRPINSHDDRACVIAALAVVDAVVMFDERTPLKLITALQPDVLVKGADYSRDEVIGATEVESHGGRVVLLPLVKGKSTSKIVRKIAG
ncbi:MAG: bifunctional D-glycero-beta-D-manno-heptose-7-phosphate kinase/D-glycero-beta-D-manno-heptose 1-phosphate adenylyltransferase HldE [Woeseia sp.]